MNRLSLACALVVAAAGASAQVEYSKVGNGTRVLGAPGFAQFRILVEESNLGSRDVEIAEITFPVEAYSRDNARAHTHGSIEIFYVLEGLLEHEVDGEVHVLKPGMIGIVRAGDTVVHRVVSDEPVRALVIWAPGGEVNRLFRRRSD